MLMAYPNTRFHLPGFSGLLAITTQPILNIPQFGQQKVKHYSKLYYSTICLKIQDPLLSGASVTPIS
jgi:hypothetical protein